MDSLRVQQRSTLYIVLCYLLKLLPSTLFEQNFFAIAQVWVTKSSNFVTFVTALQCYVNQFACFFRHSRRAFES